MDGRAIGTRGGGILVTCCALWLGACSSQAPAESGADAAADRQVDGVVVDFWDSPTPDGSNCGITTHLLIRQAPPSDCTFSLDSVPPAPNVVRVRAGAALIPFSDSDGWVYEPGMLAITFNGSYCQSVRDGTLGDLTMLFGCAGSPIP